MGEVLDWTRVGRCLSDTTCISCSQSPARMDGTCDGGVWARWRSRTGLKVTLVEDFCLFVCYFIFDLSGG